MSGQIIKIIIVAIKMMSIYDIADYYQNDFGRKNSFSANMSQSLPEGWGSVSLVMLPTY